MCFNETASRLLSPLVQCVLYIVYKKMYVFSFLYVTIVLMQLVEYYGHLALTTKNTKLNKQAAIAGMVLLVTQPVIWAMYISYVHTKNTRIQTVILVTSILFILLSIILSTIIEKTDGFKFAYLHDKCNSPICRLKWKYMSESTIGSFMFLLVYVFLFAYPCFQIIQQKTKETTYFSVVITLLVLGIMYMILCDKITNGKEILGGFGSIWCFLCVFTGPLIIMFPKLATI